MFVKIIREIHRVLGIVLGTLFFVWFASGLVMVYHTFPKVTKDDRVERFDYLADANLPSGLLVGRKTPLTISSYLGEVRVNGKALSGAEPKVWDVARRWNSSEIVRVDTLYKLEQWIPFDRYEKMMPIYKFYYGDEAKHQLYVASTNGDVLQYTSRKSRFWAWLGAIPHWVYFTRLRQNTALWVSVVVWLSALGCVMCVAGMFMSLYDAIKTKRIVPFRKFWFKWHHILGLVFGLVALAFAFSGLMSLANISGWLPKPTMEVSPQRVLSRGVDIRTTFKLDYRDVLRRYPEAKELEFTAVAGIPYYVVRTDSTAHYISANSTVVKELELAENECNSIVRFVHGEDAILTTDYMTEYDRYYVGRKGRYALPLWRVEVVGDADMSRYYINPHTANVNYVNYTARVRHWLYPALHSLRFVWLVKYPLLWTVVMWLFMVGGALLSLSGVWLGIRYLYRFVRRR
ncbi:MAG: PepSY domain-containing protein [Rikenellaceae bacterium]